jgi:hypothetical protein
VSTPLETVNIENKVNPPVEGNSLERINQYLNNDQEPKSTEGGVPPAYWPSTGSLRVENLSARYSEVCTAELDFGVFFIQLINVGWSQCTARRILRSQEW